MNQLKIHVDGAARVARFDADWLIECRIVDLAHAPFEARTPDAESFLLVLSGTHDLYAGGGSWMRRGLRPDPFSGRPVGVFLPPSTPYRLENGVGRAIVFSTRQPTLPEPESPKESLSKQPLLQMAGSGKAFDPQSGTWKPKEAFLASSEAILPRRIARIAAGDAEAQRILDFDYKSLGLCLDEIALAEGQTARMPAHAGSQRPREVGLYFETEGEMRIGTEPVTGSGVVRFCDDALELTATRGRGYAAIVYAGPKSPN